LKKKTEVTRKDDEIQLAINFSNGTVDRV